MVKNKRFIFFMLMLLAIAVIFAPVFFTRGISNLLPLVIKYRYGFTVEINELSGGFFDGVTLKGLKIYDDKHKLLTAAPELYTNITIKDLVFPDGVKNLYIYLANPEIYLRYPLKPVYLPFQANMEIILAHAELHLEDEKDAYSLALKDLAGKIRRADDAIDLFFYSRSDNDNSDDFSQAVFTGKIGFLENLVNCKLMLKKFSLASLQAQFSGVELISGEIDLELAIVDNALSDGFLTITDGQLKFSEATTLPVNYSGRIDLDENGIKIANGEIELGTIKTQISGSVTKEQKLNLLLSSSLLDSPLLLTGNLQIPEISTTLGPLETVIKIQGVKYRNNEISVGFISGGLKLSGFDTIALTGGLNIFQDEIIFKDVILADLIRISGDISRKQKSRLLLSIANAAGEQLANYLPVALRPFVVAHQINGFISIYGLLQNIQAGGRIKLCSYPLEIACRYRGQHFSFRSLPGGPLTIAGTIDWSAKPKIKIKGAMQEMGFRELLTMFSSNVSPSVTGTVTGDFVISGEIDLPQAMAKLEIQNGVVGGIEFDTAYLNLEWSGSVFDIKHSMVYYKEIPARLVGYIDPASKDILSNIEIIPSGDVFIWKGVNVKKDSLGERVTFGREIGDNVSVNFKSPPSSDPGDGQTDNDPELELKYKFDKDKNILIKLEEDQGTVGVEHNVKF